MAHEARRPLSALVAALDEGLSGVTAPKEAMTDATAQAEALNEFVDDLLEAGRVMTGSIPLASQVVGLDDVASGLVESPARAEAEVRLDLQPVTVLGSPGLLRLALTNLVRNAAQHAYGCGPGIIGIRVDAAGVTVTDEGPGMDEAALSELKASDVWVGRCTTHLGLGLALAGWVADIHDGVLELSNRPGGGLEARLALPVLPARAAGAAIGG